MAPEATSKNLLYISDDYHDVNVYSYPDGKLKGALHGFSDAGGLCVDKAGDVFVVDNVESDVLEYAHGGKKPIRTISDSGYLPGHCSVDATTGDLAVASACAGYHTTCTGPGDVAVYKDASGTPVSYTDGLMGRPFFCDYDNEGNLFVDGVDGELSGFQLAELKKGKSTFLNIAVNRQIYDPGGVWWDGKYLAVGDQNAGGRELESIIYQFHVVGSKGTAVSTMRLQGAGDVAQFWIRGSTLVAADERHPADIRYWSYPAGGPPLKIITAGIQSPVGGGTAISPAQ